MISVEVTKPCTVLGKKVKKGEELRLEHPLASRLIDRKLVKTINSPNDRQIKSAENTR